MKETFGISGGGGGGLFSFTKMEIPERWGVLAGIPSVVGVWIFSGTTQAPILAGLRVTSVCYSVL